MEKGRVARNSILIGSILILSKITGFLRELLIAVIYGATVQSDIFKIATTIPIVLFSCISSTIITTFIPVFASIKNDRLKADKFFSNILNLIFLAAAAITCISIAASPILVKMFASGFSGATYTAAVNLTRIVLPSIIFWAIASLYTSYLQSYGVFLQPSLTDIVASLVIISVMIIFRNNGIAPAVVSVLLGSVAQIAVQRPFIKNFKYRFIIDFKDQNIHQIIHLGIPVFMSNLVGQISLILNRTMLSRLEAGSISIIDYAMKISTIINQVFVVAVVTVFYPILTEKFIKEDKQEFNDMVTKLINFVFIIAIPLIAMFVVFSEPAVEILFKHGKFDSTAAMKTANCVKLLAVGTLGYAILDTVSKVFFSARNTRIPMYNSFITAILNIFLLIRLIAAFGIYGAAAATAITGLIMAVIILIELKFNIVSIKLSESTLIFFKCIVSAVIMALTVRTAYLITMRLLISSIGEFEHILLLFFYSIFALILYILILKVLKVKEIRALSKRKHAIWRLRLYKYKN